MKKLFLALALIATPFVAHAQDMETYVFEPTAALSTLGVIYTFAMVFLFLYVGWLSKRRVASSEDYFAAGRVIR